MLLIEEASAIHQKKSINNPFYFFLLPYTLPDEIQLSLKSHYDIIKKLYTTVH